MNHLIAALKTGFEVELNPEYEAPAKGVIEELDMEGKKLKIIGDDRTFAFHDIEKVNGQYVFDRLYNVYWYKVLTISEFVGHVDVKTNKNVFARWLIGQALDGIGSVGSPHPVTEKFVKQYIDQWSLPAADKG